MSGSDKTVTRHASRRVRQCSHGWRGSSAERIQEQCPSCGSTSLFIGSGGYITCSVLGCKRPGTFALFQELQQYAIRLAEACRITDDFLGLLQQTSAGKGALIEEVLRPALQEWARSPEMGRTYEGRR